MDSPAHPDDSRPDAEVVRFRMTDPLDLSPCWLTVHPTDRCNHRCDWCWYERTSDVADEVELLAAIRALVDGGVQDIAVSGGGEPTMFRGFDTLLSMFEQMEGVRRKLYTNGSRIDRFGGLANAFDYIRVSLDAGGPDAYALEDGCDPSDYHRILESVAGLATQTRVGVSAVVTARNVASMPQLLADCERFGIPTLFLKPLLVGFEREELPILPTLQSDLVDVHLVRDLLGRYENLPTRSVAALPLLLAPDGFAYPCAHAFGPDFRLGTLADVAEPEWSSGSRRAQVLDSYAAFPHSCRAFDAWLDFARSGT